MTTICHHTMSLDGVIGGSEDSMDWAFGYGEATSMARSRDGRALLPERACDRQLHEDRLCLAPIVPRSCRRLSATRESTSSLR